LFKFLGKIKKRNVKGEKQLIEYLLKISPFSKAHVRKRALLIVK